MGREDTHYRLVLFERLAEEFGECNENNPDWQPGRKPRNQARFESIVNAFADVYGGAVDTIVQQVESATSRTAHGNDSPPLLMQMKVDAYRAGMIDCALAFGKRAEVGSSPAGQQATAVRNCKTG